MPSELANRYTDHYRSRLRRSPLKFELFSLKIFTFITLKMCWRDGDTDTCALHDLKECWRVGDADTCVLLELQFF